MYHLYMDSIDISDICIYSWSKKQSLLLLFFRRCNFIPQSMFLFLYDHKIYSLFKGNNSGSLRFQHFSYVFYFNICHHAVERVTQWVSCVVPCGFLPQSVINLRWFA